MSETRPSRDLRQQSIGSLQRFFGVFVAPVLTFTSLRHTPRWFDALALAMLITSASAYAFSASDLGARLMAEHRAAFFEASGRHVRPDDFATLVVREQHGAWLAGALDGTALLALTFIAAIGGLAIAQLVLVLDTPPRTVPAPSRSPAKPELSPGFRHALAISAHASLIPAIATPARLLLNICLGVVGPSTSIGVLLSFLPPDTVWAHLGNAIDLFGLWWAHTLAIGFAIVYLRRPDGLRLLFIGLYLLAAVMKAAMKAFAGAPSF